MLTLLGSCIYVEFTLDAFAAYLWSLQEQTTPNTAWHDHLWGIGCVPGIQRYKALQKKKEAKELTSTDKVLGFQPFLKIHLMRMNEWSAILTTQKLENNHEVIAFQKVK